MAFKSATEEMKCERPAKHGRSRDSHDVNGPTPIFFYFDQKKI